MTYDVVALVRRAPDMRALVDSMVQAGPDLTVTGAGEGAVIRLRDDAGRPLLSIEAAQQVEVRGEVDRLLGAEIAANMPDPCWWVEARAAGSGPEPAALAQRFAAALTGRLGGTVWPPPAADEPGPAAGPAAAGPGTAPASGGGL